MCPLSNWTTCPGQPGHGQGSPITRCLSLARALSLGRAVFDFHQAVDGLQEVQRQAQEGKK